MIPRPPGAVAAPRGCAPRHDPPGGRGVKRRWEIVRHPTGLELKILPLPVIPAGDPHARENVEELESV